MSLFEDRILKTSRIPVQYYGNIKKSKKNIRFQKAGIEAFSGFHRMKQPC
jgi:hypothetical protein